MKISPTHNFSNSFNFNHEEHFNLPGGLSNATGGCGGGCWNGQACKITQSCFRRSDLCFLGNVSCCLSCFLFCCLSPCPIACLAACLLVLLLVLLPVSLSCCLSCCLSPCPVACLASFLLVLLLVSLCPSGVL